jgi:hypothetical protein
MKRKNRTNPGPATPPAAAPPKGGGLPEATGQKPGKVVDPTKRIKIEKNEIFNMVTMNRGLDENMKKIAFLERMHHKELKFIHNKLDLIEEQSEQYVKTLQEKYKFIGKIKSFDQTTNEIILE